MEESASMFSSTHLFQSGSSVHHSCSSTGLACYWVSSMYPHIEKSSEVEMQLSPTCHVPENMSRKDHCNDGPHASKVITLVRIWISSFSQSYITIAYHCTCSKMEPQDFVSNSHSLQHHCRRLLGLFFVHCRMRTLGGYHCMSQWRDANMHHSLSWFRAFSWSWISLYNRPLKVWNSRNPHSVVVVQSEWEKFVTEE